MASTLVIIVSIVAQLFLYLLILGYLWYCYPKKTAYKVKHKLKSEVVMVKRLRTPSEKIKAWMESAEFRIRPEPDLELGFPPVRITHAENLETPRLTGAGSLGTPVIASDGGEERPNEASLEEIESTTASSLHQDTSVSPGSGS